MASVGQIGSDAFDRVGAVIQGVVHQAEVVRSERVPASYDVVSGTYVERDVRAAVRVVWEDITTNRAEQSGYVGPANVESPRDKKLLVQGFDRLLRHPMRIEIDAGGAWHVVRAEAVAGDPAVQQAIVREVR